MDVRPAWMRGAYAVLLAGVLGGPAAAQQLTWMGAVGSEWYTAGNWSPAGYPSDESVRILNVGSASTAQAVRVAGGGEIRVGGAAVDIADALTVELGGQLEVTAGELLAAEFTSGGLVSLTGGWLKTAGGLRRPVGGRVDWGVGGVRYLPNSRLARRRLGPGGAGCGRDDARTAEEGVSEDDRGDAK